MNRYKNFCTAEQTKKALELGAPIEFASINDIRLGRYIEVENNNKVYKIPTTEQMIGWLEEQEEFSNICIRKTMGGNYSCGCYCNGKTLMHKTFYSRKEATLEAIDTALEYLSNNKK